MSIFKFTKEQDHWYLDWPAWTGAKWELEMVQGADTLLDILAQGDDVVHSYISTKPFNSDMVLTFQEEHLGGANYLLTSEHHNFPIWLCHVTKFVFGHFPKKIYLK